MFMLMFTVTYNLSKDDAVLLSCRTTNIVGESCGMNRAETFNIISSIPGIPAMDAVLSTPILVELTGAGFDIPKGAKDYVLRWPRIQKVHMDRDWKEGVSREELQILAIDALSKAKDGERERWEDALGVVDRFHAADGTVVPSSKLRENVKGERVGSKDEGRYGVEMRYGLDIEGILKRGRELKGELEVAGNVKRQANDPGTNKRICLRVTSPQPVNHSTQQIEYGLQKFDDNIERLLFSATILSATKAHQDDISQFIPTAQYLDLSKNDSDKENVLWPANNKSSEYVVLVDRYHESSVRKVLGMVRQASSFGGQWHVYNWKIVRCIHGDTETNWRNEHLWTYIDGIAH